MWVWPLNVLFGRPHRLDPKILGRRGESRARRFYRVRGFRIAASNCSIAGGEIDLVAVRGRLVVIVEVKTRQSLSAGEGSVSVDRQKQTQLLRVGGAWLAQHGGPRTELRYDVLSLFWNGRRFIISHYPDAFRPTNHERQPWRWRS